MNTAQDRFTGYPPAIREALEARAESERNLREVSEWLLAHLTAELAEDVTPQQLTDLWRDHALLVKRAAKLWAKTHAAVIEALGDGAQ